MRIPTTSTTTTTNAETLRKRNSICPTLGRNRTPKTPRTQTNGGKQTMTTKQRTTVSKTNNAEGNPPPPRKGEKNRPTPNSGELGITDGTLQTPNLQTPKPTTTTTTTKNTKNKPYLQTPIKPRSTRNRQKGLKCKHLQAHKTQRGTHIQIGKLTVTQNRTTHIAYQTKNHMYRSERTPYILNMHGKQSKNKQRGETKQ